MDINKINSKLNKKYNGKVTAALDNVLRCTKVSGELDSWEDIIDACRMCVSDDPTWHVVNKIKLKDVEIPEIHKPLTSDNSLDGLKVDVLVIGGGICGASILRELTKWKINCLLVEKESDLAMGASGRNDGEVHPGVDQSHMNLKLKYELIGNAMYEDLCKDLDVPFKRNGQYVAFKGKWLKPVLEILATSKRKLGIKDTKIVNKEELYKAQPNLNEGYDVGIYNACAGTVCPYGLTIAYGENAINNGAKIALNTIVNGFELKDKKIVSVKTNRGTIYPRIVINAAGVFSDTIASYADDEFFSIHPRKGTEAILDNKQGSLTNAIISWRALFGNDKHTKGGGVLHTVHHNILVGPDAKETYEKENFATSKESIDFLFNKQRKTFSKLNERDIITYFTGVRAATFEEDFIIEKGRNCENIIHCAGIQSPGLTAAPAIALDIEKMTVEMLGDCERNENFDPIRKGIPSLKNMPLDQRNEMIKKNPDYGVIVCRCEEISKGEIIDCLKSPLCVPTIDGIKKRVRPGMGRCQGGFCSPLVSKIIADYMNIDIKDVSKCGNSSYISIGKKGE